MPTVPCRNCGLPTRSLHEYCYRTPECIALGSNSRQRKARGHSHVKLIYVLGSDSFTYMKIGYTQMRMVYRLVNIQVGSPFKLFVLAVYPGTRDLETFIHTELAEYQLLNEWFDLGPSHGRALELIENTIERWPGKL